MRRQCPRLNKRVGLKEALKMIAVDDTSELELKQVAAVVDSVSPVGQATYDCLARSGHMVNRDKERQIENDARSQSGRVANTVQVSNIS